MDIPVQDRSKYRVSKNMYTISAVCFACISLITYFDNIIYFAQAASALCMSVISYIILVKTKNYKLPIYITICLSVFLHSLGFLTASFVSNQLDIFWILVISLFSFYLVGRVWALVYFIANITIMIAIKLLKVNNIITLPFKEILPNFASQLNYVVNFTACSILFIYLVNNILKEYESTQRRLLDSNAALSAKDIEKSTMLKEIHHRVKNNLQVIVSLLRLQLFQLSPDDEITGPFQDSITRISTMAMIHEKMYQGDKINNLNVEQYVSDLADDLVRTYATSTRVTLSVNSEVDQLKMDDLVPFSLILNELITNSIKHGFRNHDKGSIEVNLSKTDIGFNLVFKDSGEWLENEEEQTFGLELIDTLNGHFDGIYQKNSTKNGTVYIFNFKVY